MAEHQLARGFEVFVVAPAHCQIVLFLFGKHRQLEGGIDVGLHAAGGQERGRRQGLRGVGNCKLLIVVHYVLSPLENPGLIVMFES